MANVQIYSVAQQGNLQLSANFLVREFASQDGADTVLIDLDLVKQLQSIRDKLGVPITVTSGYRTAAHNASVGGEPGSLHTLGRAADIIARGKTTLEIAGCVSLTVDGVYCESTMDAVRTLQSTKGLPVTGVTDPDTFAALFG